MCDHDSRRVHLGPYFECRNSSVEHVKGRGCVNRDCHRFHREVVAGDGQFCKWCGQTLAEYSTDTPLWTISIRQVVGHDGFDMELAGPGGHDLAVMLWIPEARRGQPRSFEVDAGVFSCGDWDSTAERDWLDAAFGSEKKRFREIYGPTNVETQWGLIVWRE